jgi:hypothetical protein
MMSAMRVAMDTRSNETVVGLIPKGISIIAFIKAIKI